MIDWLDNVQYVVKGRIVCIKLRQLELPDTTGA